MRAKTRKAIIISLVLIVTIGACQPIGNQNHKYPSTIGTFNDTGDFIIDPMTILDALERGETNVFSPTLATPGDDAILPSGSIQWTQSDYLKIANALSQSIWNEPLDDWLIYYLRFENTCQDNLSGFDSFEAIYYKTIGAGAQKIYTARYIEIYPLARIIYWGGDTDFPISSGWAAIDLRKFKITADDALRIAEENGGVETRVRARNECSISINLPDGNNDGKWDIAYYYSPIFEIFIDPYSGKYEVATPSP